MANAQEDDAPVIGDTLILWDGRRGVVESVVALDDGEQMYRVAPTAAQLSAGRSFSSHAT